MERKRYLELCQINSVYKGSKKVYFDGIEYFPLSYEMSFENGVAINSAVLMDKKANSLVKAKIERIEEVEA